MSRPWFLIMLQRARLFDLVQSVLLRVNRGIDAALAGVHRRRAARGGAATAPLLRAACSTWRSWLSPLAAAVWIVVFVRGDVADAEIGWVFVLGLITRCASSC